MACTNTASLVDSWPSTEIRSKLRFTHTRVSSSTVSASSAASVWTKHSIVAKCGEIMPPPLAWPARRTVPPEGSASSRQARLGPLSVVRIDSENAWALGASDWAAWRIPATALSRGSSRAITPVEATATCAGIQVQRLGRGVLLGPGRLQAPLGRRTRWRCPSSR